MENLGRQKTLVLGGFVQVYKEDYTQPWVIVGDFNQIPNQHDKRGGATTNMFHILHIFLTLHSNPAVV